MSTHLRNIDHAAVERTAIPEAILRTAQAAVTRLDRERNAIIPACGRAGVIGGWPFATHFVQAVTFARGVVIPTLDELSGVKVSAAIAFIVNTLTIEHQRTPHSVD